MRASFYFFSVVFLFHLEVCAQQLPLCIDYYISSSESDVLEDLDLKICNCKDSLWLPKDYEIRSLRLPYWYDGPVREILMSHPEIENLDISFSGSSLRELTAMKFKRLKTIDISGTKLDPMNDYAVLNQFRHLEVLMLDEQQFGKLSGYLQEHFPALKAVVTEYKFQSLYAREAEMMDYFRFLEYPFSFRGRFSVKIKVGPDGYVESYKKMDKRTERKLNEMDMKILQNFLIFRNNSSESKEVILTLKIRG